MRILLLSVCLCGPVWSSAWGQAAGPSQADLDEAVRQGTVATLAPICGMRDEAWAFDLRRAALMQATRGAQPDDATLQAAPGRKLVESALSFAEDEALESFAQTPPATTCAPLARDPALARADAEVQAFRALKARSKPSS